VTSTTFDRSTPPPSTSFPHDSLVDLIELRDQYIVLVSETPVDRLRKVVARLGLEVEEDFMTTADMLRAEGRAEGEAKGRAETLTQLLTRSSDPCQPRPSQSCTPPRTSNSSAGPGEC